jgi:hypothetical protein
VAAAAAGLVVTVALSFVDPVVRAVRSRTALVAGRVALGVLTVAVLPGALSDLHAIVVRDEPAALRASAVVSSQVPSAASAPHLRNVSGT